MVRLSPSVFLTRFWPNAPLRGGEGSCSLWNRQQISPQNLQILESSRREHHLQRGPVPLHQLLTPAPHKSWPPNAPIQYPLWQERQRKLSMGKSAMHWEGNNMHPLGPSCGSLDPQKVLGKGGANGGKDRCAATLALCSTHSFLHRKDVNCRQIEETWSEA